MNRNFVPQYDVKIRGSKHFIEWRYGAHPTFHTFSNQDLVGKLSSTTSSNTVGSFYTASPSARRPLAGGTLWADANTKPLNQFPLTPRTKKKSLTKDSEFKLTEAEDISLRNDVKQGLQKVHRRYVRALLPSFRKLDKLRTGKLNSEKVRQILQQNQLSLSEPSFRKLEKKFSERDKEGVTVRYEQMIPYLSKIWTEVADNPQNTALETTAPPAAGLFSYGSDSRLNNFGRTANSFGSSAYNTGGGVYSSYSNPSIYTSDLMTGLTQNTPSIFEMRNKVVFNDIDESRLLADLERELSVTDANMADLRRTMYDLDRDRNDFLNEEQVETAFHKCGIFLSPDVFRQLLFATDRTGAGVHQIEKLLNYLTKFKPEEHNHLIMSLGQNHSPRKARIPVSPYLPNQPLFSTPWPNMPREMQNEANYDNYSQIENNDPSIEEDILEEESPAVLDFEEERWRRDFLSFVQTLNRADTSRTGFLPEGQLIHLTRTYSLVCDLGISDNTLNNALQTSLDRTFNEVHLDQFASKLRELHYEKIKQK